MIAAVHRRCRTIAQSLARLHDRRGVRRAAGHGGGHHRHRGAVFGPGADESRSAAASRKPPTLAEQIAKRIRETKEGHAGFATTIGVLCDQQSKPKLPQDVAAREAACWEDEVERKLPSGLGTITRDTLTSPPTYVIAVSWSAPDAGTASYVIG